MDRISTWKMMALEERGVADTNDGLINRVAYELAKCPHSTIDNQDFINACLKCNVDPYSWTKTDMDKLQKKLNKIT